MTRAYDRALQHLDIKASQFNVLAAIAASETATMAALTQMLAMERTTLLRNIQPLRNGGYIDARGRGAKAELTLTISGQALLTEASHAWRAAQQTLTQRLGASKAGALLQTLAGIAAP